MNAANDTGLTKGFQQIAKTSSSIPDDPLTIFSQASSKTTKEAGQEKVVSQSESKPQDILSTQTLPMIKPSSQDSQKSSIGISFDDMEFPFLSGETRIMHVKDTYAYFGVEKHVPCTLVMTNYRISLTPNPYLDAKYLARNKVSMLSWLNIPLSSVEKIEKEISRISDSKVLTTGLIIVCKDVRSVKIVSHAKSSFEFDVDKAFDLINGYCFPQKLEYLFAFAYSPSSLVTSTKFDAIDEYNRMGIDEQHTKLRICRANSAYKVCDTYPSIIVVPNNISDSEIWSAASFRSGQRLPSMCWASKLSKGTMWRSAQPKAGMSGRNEIDEKLLLSIAQTGSRPEPVLYIVDCRPQTSALANKAAGAGYESQSNYPYAKLDFFNIPNIHAVRQSYQRMVSLVSNSSNGNDPYFQKKIEDTQWLLYIRLILKASWDSANMLLQEFPVLVHCSHGWDRTSQVCAIGKLLL